MYRLLFMCVSWLRFSFSWTIRHHPAVLSVAARQPALAVHAHANIAIGRGAEAGGPRGRFSGRMGCLESLPRYAPILILEQAITGTVPGSACGKVRNFHHNRWARGRDQDIRAEPLNKTSRTWCDSVHFWKRTFLTEFWERLESQERGHENV